MIRIRPRSPHLSQGDLGGVPAGTLVGWVNVSRTVSRIETRGRPRAGRGSRTLIGGSGNRDPELPGVVRMRQLWPLADP